VLTVTAFLCGVTVEADSPPPATVFEAGVAVEEITPPVGYRLSGYFYERLSTGTRDPLHAKALYLRQGDVEAALVFCDLIGISLDVSSKARRLAAQRTGIPAAHILVAATHSHTGPLYFGALREHFHRKAAAAAPDGKDPHEAIDYPAELTSKVVAAVERARKAARAVNVSVLAAHEERLSFNRRFHMRDGTVRFNPGKKNPDIVRPAGPIDPDLHFVLFREAGKGEPGPALFGLTVFALHLDTVGGTEYSADFPYWLEGALRSSFSPDFVSLFGAGTCGDLNHIDVGSEAPQKGGDETRRIGEALAKAIRDRVEDDDGLREIAAPSLAVKSGVVEWPLQRASAEELAWAREAMERVGDNAVPFLERVKAYKLESLAQRGGDKIALELQAFRIGEELAIVSLPGEVFVELGLAIKKASPFRTTLVIELANDAPGYVPTRKAFAEGSYEVVNSRVAPGGGEATVELAGKLLRELAGAAKQ
jgi:hypothetical protein